MTVRLHVGALPAVGQTFVLPEDAARHAQVRRVQPGDGLRVFDGAGREHEAQVQTMGRREVVLCLGPAVPPTPEPTLSITLAVGVPANERMDTLVEKAVELGAAAIQPLACERTVLRLEGERAVRRQAHWQAVAVAACEQCGRAYVPPVAPMRSLPAWLGAGLEAPVRLLLSLAPDALPLYRLPEATSAVVVLSGPEGGLAPAEEALARAAGFMPVSLGPRILRADTAPLALLAGLLLRG
ncbi:MAG: ribosomal small subunit methyltransferase RsmE [Pseudomonadota bacterium]|jgi:16S rRNA (uracil1498-N3)-methyltransferase